MGNATGKLNSTTACDGGGLVPNGIYPESPQDFDARVVQRLIVARQLAPFYEGSDDMDPDPEGAQGAKEGRADDGWWSYNLMVAQQQSEQQQSDKQQSDKQQSDKQQSHKQQPVRRQEGHTRKGSGFFQRLRATSSSSSHHLAVGRHERSFSDIQKSVSLDQDEDEQRAVAACRRALRRCVECPICFLYYPRNINYTRCCHKPICTECFVQIKRKVDEDGITATCCPYCVREGLGVIYHAPMVLAELGRAGPGAGVPRRLEGRARSQSSSLPREPVVVTSDDIRPALVRELAAQLDAKRKRQLRSAEHMAMVAEATRRMSARDARREASASQSRPTAPRGYASYIAAMEAAGQTNLDEFLLQEAIRQSMAEQEALSTSTRSTEARSTGARPTETLRSESPEPEGPEPEGPEPESRGPSQDATVAQSESAGDIGDMLPRTNDDSDARQEESTGPNSSSTASSSSSSSRAGSASLCAADSDWGSSVEDSSGSEAVFVSAAEPATATSVASSTEAEAAVAAGSSSGGHLVLDEADLDAIASMGISPRTPTNQAQQGSVASSSRAPTETPSQSESTSPGRKRRPPPPPVPLHRPVSPASSNTLTPPALSGPDLMSFDVPAELSCTNPFRAQRRRRAPPPPPPPAAAADSRDRKEPTGSPQANAAQIF
ncbi:SNF1-interacting protein [Coemansia sp. RSA 552]|nr:SNF1-interacting protein [Coemansia sp. RSA 552]